MKKQIRQHEPLRVPNHWTDQERGLVIQLNRMLDEIYLTLGELEKKIRELSEEDEP